MECKICGKEIAEGREYCDECAALVPDEEVIHITKEDIKKLNKKEPRLKADGPFINVEGYAKSLVTNYANILAVIGAVLMYLSPYFSWLKIKTDGRTIKGSMFDIAGKYINDVIALKQPVLIVCGILFIISGIMMLIFSARENIRLLRPYADNYLLRLIPVVFAAAAFIMVITNGAYKNVFKNSHVEGGAGKTMCIIGVIVYILSIVMDKANANSEQ